MNRTAFWVAPGVTAALALAFYGPFGFGRDVGAFLIGLMLVPLLGLIALGLGAWALLERKPRRKEIVFSSSIAALAPAILIPMLWIYGEALRDPARFAVWAATHPSDLAAARRRDGVFRHWDGWGMAGSENDSYLASDPDDSLSNLDSANTWAKAHHLGCDIVSVRRMERGVYLLTTYECPIGGFPF